MVMGLDQGRPLSLERMITVDVMGVALLALMSSVNMSTKVPFSKTTIWFEIAISESDQLPPLFPFRHFASLRHACFDAGRCRY